MNETGTFRKKNGFTIAGNTLVRDNSISLKAKGLYLLIMSYITLEDLKLTKSFLQNKCGEGTKAFCSAWDELKESGYLKVYMSPANPGWKAEYDLREEPLTGPHTFYLSSDGVITSNNEKKYCKIETKNTDETQRTPQKGVYAKGNFVDGIYAEGTYANGGNNIKPSCKTPDNTSVKTPSIKHDKKVNLAPVSDSGESSDGLSDGELKSIVEQDIEFDGLIPYTYQNDPRKIYFALKLLIGYDTKIAENVLSDHEKNTLDVMMECLVEMACTNSTQNYKGSIVCNAKVIDKLNDCILSDGGLDTFVDMTIDDYVSAAGKREIKNEKNYMKSVIWSSFSTYKLKFDSYFARTYRAGP